MDTDTLIQRLKLLLIHLDEVTKQYCYNDLSTNYRFIIEPNDSSRSNHLSDIENSYLTTWNKLKNKIISYEEVIELFVKNNKTTKWADCSIYFSTPNLTIVHIFFSRQFRDDSEIYYVDRGTGPFKAVVPMPPDHLKVIKEDKFDINWKKYRDDSDNSYLARFKRLFR